MFILVFVFAQIWWFPLKKKKIQICNSNLIIRQILLVFEAGYDMKNNTGRGIEVSLELNIHTSSLLFCTFTSKAVL